MSQRFRGILCQLDQPSTKPPAGAREHCIILTLEAAQAALSELPGKPVNFHNGINHDTSRITGHITGAFISPNLELYVEGILTESNITQNILSIIEAASSPMGMSYELADASIKNMRSVIWSITKCTFTGVALILQKNAVYSNSTFEFLPLTDEEVLNAKL